ncbi:MAG: shikimate dehydrogenase [Verrucomicrobiales bacterium]|nr:shikimate dehydrogenase [Verrucomicrobiales bacterium]
MKPPVSNRTPSPISAATRHVAVYGHPIRHSASPAMQNAGLDHLGLDWRYLAFDVRPEELGPAIAGARAMRFLGLNLTVPHKLLAVNLVDELDESARTWGAVNTIRFEARDARGEWQPLGKFDELPEDDRILARGFNTDADAIVRSLREDLGVEPAGAKVVLLGAGGAGRTAALRLAVEGVGKLWLVNRTTAKAATLADDIRQLHPATAVSVGYPKEPVDLLLNATSLGLKPSDSLPVDTEAFRLANARAVYDMVYRPAETPLLKAAADCGCRTANGIGMLLYQGARALELWTGRPAPVEVMRRALEANVYGVAPV